MGVDTGTAENFKMACCAIQVDLTLLSAGGFFISMLMTASAGGKHFRSGVAAVGAEAGALLVSEEFCICPVERAFIAPVNNVLWIFFERIYHDVEKKGETCVLWSGEWVRLCGIDTRWWLLLPQSGGSALSCGRRIGKWIWRHASCIVGSTLL